MPGGHGTDGGLTMAYALAKAGIIQVAGGGQYGAPLGFTLYRLEEAAGNPAAQVVQDQGLWTFRIRQQVTIE